MIPLTLLYAPADRPELVRKALEGVADVVIIDLEDAVAPAAKDAARAGLAELLIGFEHRPVQVRINAIGTPWAAADLAAVAGLPVAVEVRAPKVESPEQVAHIAEASGGRPVHALLETPLAIERAFEIAISGVASLGLGEADLRSALGVMTADDLGWQRGRVVNAAAAAGLGPPAMSVYAQITDTEGLAASCRAGRAAGFLGRAAIHPLQLPVIVASFLPTPEEVERARRIVEGFAQATEAGGGTYVMQDGAFIDIAMIRAAQGVLDLHATHHASA